MVVAVDWATLSVAIVSGLGSGVLVAVATHLLAERSIRKGFRRQRLFDLKLDAYTEFLAALDMMISSLETTLKLGRMEVGTSATESLTKQGIPEPLAKLFLERVGGAMQQSLTRASWSVLGYDGPITEARPPTEVRPPAGGSDPLAGIEDSIQSGLRPFLSVMTEAQKRLDRCFVRLSLLGVPEEVETAISRLRRRMGKFGFEGGLALSTADMSAKERLTNAWRKDWSAIAEECRKDLSNAMN